MAQAACNANVDPRSLSFKLEAVSGLSQQALIIDVAAKTKSVYLTPPPTLVERTDAGGVR